ncbi:hypothetical protein PTKIN_Ptkin03bG0157300 [Pterospermum kingtungense]
MRTAWSNQNPGRRFLGCKGYGSSSACGFFAWYDPPMPDRARIVVLGLLKKIWVYFDGESMMVVAHLGKMS